MTDLTPEEQRIVAWLREENELCDCFARSETECGCGAWDSYKTVLLSRIWEAIERGEHRVKTDEPG